MTSIYIYVLADYNAGSMVGDWVDVSHSDQDQLDADCLRILAQSKMENAEELAIADYDGFYGLSPNLSDVITTVERLEEYGEAYALYTLDVGENYADNKHFEEAYCGAYDTFRDYADELFDACYLHEVPNSIHIYIDYQKFADDLIYGGDYFTVKGENGQIHVFSSL
jgi:antirestriction protein